MNLWLLTDAQGRVINLCRHDMTGKSGWTAGTEALLGISADAPLFDARGACLYALENGALCARTAQARCLDALRARDVFFGQTAAQLPVNSTLFDVPLDGFDGARFGFELVARAADVSGNSGVSLHLYVNGNLTDADYLSQYTYGSSTLNRTMVAYDAASESYTGFARGEMSYANGVLLYSGLNQRGVSTRAAALFSGMCEISALSSLQICTKSGTAAAGCTLRVWAL